MVVKFLWNEVSFGNFQLFFGDITADFYHFHPVAQGGIYCGNVVGSSYKHHFREVVFLVDEIIVEFGILFRVKYFEQC